MYDIYVYGDIGDSWGDGITPGRLARQLEAADGGPVVIHVNSAGGDVFAANAMAELIRSYEGDTEARIEGIAASAASYFALTADRVSMSENAILMIHNPYALCVGEADEMRKTAEMLDKVRATIVNQYETKTGMDRERIEELMDAESYFEATEALDMGFVDVLIGALPVAAHVSKRALAQLKHAPESLARAAGEGGATIPPEDGRTAAGGAPAAGAGAAPKVICTNGLFLRAPGDARPKE